MEADRLSLLRGRLLSMLTLQDGMNRKINPAWRAAANPWYRAIWTECAELLDHVGWKWWKKQHPDMPQIHLELVDIFHFGLSELLQARGDANAAASQAIEAYVGFANASPVNPDCISRQSMIEGFALKVLESKQFDLETFFRLANSCGLDEITLYELYVGKNVLNTFRQEHGYKSGEYQKIWDGREDNEWLVEISASIEKDPASFSRELYARLAKKYSEVSVVR